MISKYKSFTFCKTPELIENYNVAIQDNSNQWDCHHRLETHFSDGTERPKNAQLSAAELKALDMYYNRPPEEFIYLTHSEHRALHNSGTKKSNKTKSKTEESMTKYKKYIYCHELDKTFDGIKKAGRILGLDYREISKVCRGKRKTLHGYHFTYIKETK